jgi:hypothetical protein
LKKWLKPTSNSSAAEANEAMCPPTPSSGRLARDTIAAAFQRTIASSRRSSSSSPGYSGSAEAGMVLM